MQTEIVPYVYNDQAKLKTKSKFVIGDKVRYKSNDEVVVWEVIEVRSGSQECDIKAPSGYIGTIVQKFEHLWEKV